MAKYINIRKYMPYIYINAYIHIFMVPSLFCAYQICNYTVCCCFALSRFLCCVAISAWQSAVICISIWPLEWIADLSARRLQQLRLRFDPTALCAINSYKNYRKFWTVWIPFSRLFKFMFISLFNWSMFNGWLNVIKCINKAIKNNFHSKNIILSFIKLKFDNCFKHILLVDLLFI